MKKTVLVVSFSSEIWKQKFKSIFFSLSGIGAGTQRLPPFCEGGERDWIFESFQNQEGREKEGERGIFEIFIGGKLLEMKLQTENKISEWI